MFGCGEENEVDKERSVSLGVYFRVYLKNGSGPGGG